MQYQIVGALAKANSSMGLLFVGDTDQAIFAGLGGVAKSIVEIRSITEQSIKAETINGCYRSTQRIVDYYSHFQKTKYKIHALSPHSDYHGTICLNTSVHKSDIYFAIADVIERKISEGVPQHEICVIAPQWELLYPLSNNLRKLLPYVSFDAPDISPIKADDMSIFYKLAKLISLNLEKEFLGAKELQQRY